MAFSFIPTAITSQSILLSSPNEPTTKKLQATSSSTPTQLKTRRPFEQTQEDKRITQELLSYVESGRMEDALKVFDSGPRSDLFLWNIMLRGYANTGLYQEAIEFYYRMRIAGLRADKFTFPCVIKSCAGLPARYEGLKAHGRLVKSGLNLDLFVCNSLIAMYSKFGLIADAAKVFDEMPVRDIVSWNSMIDGYVLNGDARKALSCFREFNGLMGEKHDLYGVISALTACSLERFCKHGREIHCYVIKNWLGKDANVDTSIIDMYCKCGDVNSAEKVFDKITSRTVAAWNSLIGGYSLNNQHQKAVFCLKEMLGENREPDSVTIINLLTSCAQTENISLGKAIHAYSIKRGLLPHLYLETTLIDMYGKCGELRFAQTLFDRMSERSLISWNTMLSAYMKKEKYKEAISLFVELLNGLQKNQNPDLFTISIIVPAYSELASLKHGKQIHSFVLRLGYSENTLVMNSIIYMYAKCGDLNSAREVFDKMPNRDIITWNTILLAYGIHGHGKAALDLFSHMKSNKITPNKSTFVSLLTACSVSGLINEGFNLFNSMQEEYSITPQTEHYGCMVDLLGRTGKLNETLEFIQSMPLAPSATIWGSLLTASRNNNNLELAELAAEEISKLEHDNTGCYVTMSTMYSDFGKWDDVTRVRNLMREKGLRKTIANSLVELPNKTRNFVNDDMSHPESRIINEVSDILSKKIGERKEGMVNRHSVRLGVVFGLISSGIGIPVLVKKNVRICNPCHDALKKISGFSGREIVVGDSSFYHHFSEGFCSCCDYW